MAIKPFTVTQQLQRMSAWHQAVLNRPQYSSTPSEFLVDCWDEMEAVSPNIQANKTYLLREGTHNDIPPLAQLFEYVENGLYPPPELLLTLADAWQTYTLSDRRLTLEEAFLGKPKPRAGNYAARALKKRKDMGAAFELGMLIGQGKTKNEAVVQIAEQYGASEESLRKIKPIPPLDTLGEMEESEK